MGVGYALGNKNKKQADEEEILVLGEDDPNVITFSKSTTISLYSYAEKKYTNLKIPYTTIKSAKSARSSGIREVVYEVFHRPDRSPLLRATLDLWGFDSYVNYLYTICELGFLEGLVPVIDFGFLTPDELERLFEVVAIIKTPLYTDFDILMDKDKIRKLARSKEIKEKNLSWCSKLNLPISTGFFLHNNLENSKIDSFADQIAECSANYDCVHEVFINTHSRCPDIKFENPSNAKLLKSYEILRNKIPSNVPIIFQHAPVKVLDELIANNEADIGSFSDSFLFSESGEKYWVELTSVLEKHNKRLQQRFPLRKSFIKEQKYSKKLGQVFDSFKYKIKKELIEKQKEAKQ